MSMLFRNVISAVGAAIFVLISASAFAAPWQIIESAGTVRTTSPMTGATLVSTGNTLNSGDILSTGFDGRVVLARGGQQIVVGPNSRMSLPGVEEPGMTRILQDIGTLLFKVDKRQEKHFRVETPVIAAVVKGTTFTVTAGAEAHAVHVAEGAVEVSTRNGAAMELVTAGRTVRIDRNNPSAIRFNDTASGERGRETNGVIETEIGEREANNAADGASGATREASLDGRLAVPSAIGAEPLDFNALTDGLVQSQQGKGPVVGLSRASAVANINAANPSDVAASARLNGANNGNAARANTAVVNGPNANANANAGAGNNNGGVNANANAGAGNNNGGANANANAGAGNNNGGANANANAGAGNNNGGANANANAGAGNNNGGANANTNAGAGNNNGGANANANAGAGNNNGGANANANAGAGNNNGGVNANANAGAGNGNGNSGNGNGNGGGNGTGNEGNGNGNANANANAGAGNGNGNVNVDVNLNGNGVGVGIGVNTNNNGGGNENDNGRKNKDD